MGAKLSSYCPCCRGFRCNRADTPEKVELSPKTINEEEGVPLTVVSEEIISPTDVTLVEAGLGDIDLGVSEESMEVATYCLPLLALHFSGQTSNSNVNSKETDKAEVKDVLNLGVCLSLLDKFLKVFDKVTDFTGEEEDYKLLLNLTARKRCRIDSKESADDCCKRLLNQSKRFVDIYHKRGEKSEVLNHESYWGSRQQLLAGKVIADWIDKENGPLDPVFGVLLQPTAGRVGPGDTGWFHDVLFDDHGHMAYHSAVHDAFGYLVTNHDVGPGYDYLKESIFFTAKNPMAGQTSGISFWRRTINEIEGKQKVLNHWRI